MNEDDALARLAALANLEKLSDTLTDRDAGELFQRELEEARGLAASDPRFQVLVSGLESPSLGDRMGAVNMFFKGLDPDDLATLELPLHLGQLRAIFLSSR